MASNAEASSFLSSLLNKNLRIHTTDTRIFVGQMKCTDKDRNLILSLTHEYRHPPASAVHSAAAEMENISGAGGATGSVKVDMIRRFVGLVVVPGRYITKIEVED